MIVTSELTKHYAGIVALADLSLTVAAGEIFGLLGPNGAGKTTTIKILTTLTRPTRGRAWINGLDVVKQPLAVKRLIAVCPQEINLDKELTVYENLWLYGRLYRVPQLRQRLQELLAWGRLTERARDLVKDLSGGMQRRLLILRALMSRPQVLFLDEPTVGLDPQVRRQLWDLIQDLRAEGITIVLTTHYIEEAEMLCDRVGILNRGRLIALDTPARLISSLPGFVVEFSRNGRREYHLVPDQETAYARARLASGGVTIRRVNLEDVFLQLTGERFNY